jgi:UDP-N-acetylmuramate--alanine ligase
MKSAPGHPRSGSKPRDFMGTPATRIHFVGIGGSGVSALARVFLARGAQVSGCDLKDSDTTRLLAAAGARVQLGHSLEHAAGQDLIVFSGALRPDAEELEEARRRGVRVLSRAEMLAELIAEAESVAVAGTHGKTTVTYMAGHVLTAAGFDPTVLVADGANARPGGSRWLVAEADESDRSLTLHRPRHAIVTNVELDHPDHFANVEEVSMLFREFLARLPEDGVAVLCADDERLRTMSTPARRVSYGFAEDADYRCEAGRPFPLWRRGRRLGQVALNVPGRHNVQNATAAAALGLELGIPFDTVAGALAEFRGAHRRLEHVGRWRGAELYDDYGHHPSEVRATLQAARELPHRRLVLVFQPHRYTRWAAFREDFAHSFKNADELIVTEIYPAGESNPAGLTAAGVDGAFFAPNAAAVRSRLEAVVRERDLVLFMGAGDIGRLARELAE